MADGFGTVQNCQFVNSPSVSILVGDRGAFLYGNHFSYIAIHGVQVYSYTGAQAQIENSCFDHNGLNAIAMYGGAYSVIWYNTLSTNHYLCLNNNQGGQILVTNSVIVYRVGTPVNTACRAGYQTKGIAERDR
jgi:hypothetical protein